VQLTLPVKMNRRGNIWAFLTIAILALIFILVLTRHEQLTIPKEADTETKVETITITNLMRALRQGIQEFSKGGLSLQSNLWVCNVFMPPLANEIDSNGSFLLKSDLNACFKTLAEELGYEYSEDFNVSLDIATEPDIDSQIRKMFELPEERVDINVTFIVVGTKSKHEERRLRNAYSLSFPYRIWHAYKKYFEWAQNYLQIMGEDTCEELKKTGPCLFIAYGDPSYHILIPEEYIRSKINLDVIDIDRVIEKQLDYLNQLMNTIDFNCRYIKTSEYKDLAIARDQNCLARACSGLIINDYDVPGLCGAHFARQGMACPNREPIGPWVAPPVGAVERNNTVSCPAGTCKQEIASANPYVTYSFDFVCEDNLRSISMEPNVEPSAVRIGVLVNIVRVCSPLEIPLKYR
jgi:hypothetical protein